MTKIGGISQKIEEVRTLMHQLINEKEELTDAELVALSQELDELLNEHNRLLNKKK